MIHARIGVSDSKKSDRKPMLTKTDTSALTFPAPEPPPTGKVIEIAAGILWARIPLPFRLNHINVYLIEDGDGWAVLDTGIDNEPTRAVWSALVERPAGRPAPDPPDRHPLPP